MLDNDVRQNTGMLAGKLKAQLLEHGRSCIIVYGVRPPQPPCSTPFPPQSKSPPSRQGRAGRDCGWYAIHHLGNNRAAGVPHVGLQAPPPCTPLLQRMKPLLRRQV